MTSVRYTKSSMTFLSKLGMRRPCHRHKNPANKFAIWTHPVINQNYRKLAHAGFKSCGRDVGRTDIPPSKRGH